MIDKSFLEKVEQMASVQQFTIDGRNYASKPIHQITAPLPKRIVVSTLTSFVEYVKSEIDDIYPNTHFVLVESFDRVTLFSKLETESMDRAAPISAVKANDIACADYQNWCNLETFIIALQSAFVDTPDKAKLLKLIGNLADTTVYNYSDDGISQQVVAKSGLTRVEKSEVPNPVELAPFRTFVDLEQPSSKFVFRMSQNEKAPPSCMLKPADGGAWKLEAVDRIARFVKERLPEFKVLS